VICTCCHAVNQLQPMSIALIFDNVMAYLMEAGKTFLALC